MYKLGKVINSKIAIHKNFKKAKEKKSEVDFQKISQ